MGVYCTENAFEQDSDIVQENPATGYAGSCLISQSWILSHLV